MASDSDYCRFATSARKGGPRRLLMLRPAIDGRLFGRLLGESYPTVGRALLGLGASDTGADASLLDAADALKASKWLRPLSFPASFDSSNKIKLYRWQSMDRAWPGRQVLPLASQSCQYSIPLRVLFCGGVPAWRMVAQRRQGVECTTPFGESTRLDSLD